MIKRINCTINVNEEINHLTALANMFYVYLLLCTYLKTSTV